MKKKVIAAVILAMAILTGCGDEQVPSPIATPEPISSNPEQTTPAPSPDVTAEPQATSEPLLSNGLMANGERHPITERKVVDGKMQSYLTGEWKDASVVKRRNMAVMINNIKASLPQYGISAASIIYEAPVEGRITRLMGFFEDYDDLDHIGSVRSARDYYLYEAMAYDSIYCNWGLMRLAVEGLINSDRIDNISEPLEGIKDGAPNSFGRLDRPGYDSVHSGYMFIEGYKKDVGLKKYATEYTDRFEQAFTFTDEGYVATYDSHPDATMIYPGGTQSNSGGYGISNPCFAYNAEDGLYYRTQYNQKHIDEMNNEQLAVSNVVFKICYGEERFPDDPNYDYLAFRVHGTGDAYVFTNGKVIKGTWRRDSDYAPNLFLDENGNEIVFNQGKTWICCIWEDYAKYISYE